MAAAIVKGNLEAQAQDTQMRMGIVALAVALGVATSLAKLGASPGYRAMAFVHVPHFESYAGLPALEAMAAGTPVVSVRAPGVTEALEGASLLVERRDPQLVADALAALIARPELRDEVGAAGRTRVEPLTWERAADGLAAAIRDVLG